MIKQLNNNIPIRRDIMDQSTKILLVEDDFNLGELMQDYLESEGFEVRLERDGNAGLKAYQSEHFDLCLLDVMMPKTDGYTLARKIRKQDLKVPIIFLTAKALKEDKLVGFEIGADDYITKPFDEEELVYRINAILRRTSSYHSNNTETSFKIGNYLFDYLNQELNFEDEEEGQHLTSRESDILRLLCLNKGNTLRREDALVAIWGENDYFHGRSFDVFITKIRKYLKKDPNVKIENVHGVGFKLVEEAA